MFVGLGSNVGNRGAHLKKAIGRLAGKDVKVVKASHWYETAPVGVTRQRNFFNGAIKLRTRLAPLELLKHLKRIESEMGRRPTRRWGPRLIDLDILVDGARRMTTRKLTLPHPRLMERGFALVPLSELTPLHRLPGLRRVTPR